MFECSGIRKESLTLIEGLTAVQMFKYGLPYNECLQFFDVNIGEDFLDVI